MTSNSQHPYPTAKEAKNLEDKDWLKLREFDVFKLILNEEWKYSDFDVWLSIRDTYHYELGEKRAVDALKEFQRKHHIIVT